jgi:ABC-2 type transport system permease protein
MIIEIAFQVIRGNLRKISTHIYFFVLLGLAFLLMLSAAGAFPGKVIAFGSDTREWANSPYSLQQLLINMNFIIIIVIAAIMGQTVCRDFEGNVYPLIFTKPIRKIDYLLGRFLGGYVIVIWISAGAVIGSFLATMTPFIEPSRMGPLNLLAYLNPFVISVSGTNLFVSALFFSLALIKRKMTPVYVGSILLFIGYAIAQEMIVDLDWANLASFFDPFASSTVQIATKFWSVAEKNSRLIPIEGVYLANRVFWFLCGIAILGVAYWKFSFTYDESYAKQKNNNISEINREKLHINRLSPVTKLFSRSYLLQALRSETGNDFVESVKNRYFLTICLFSMLMIAALSTILGTRFDTPSLPVTYEILEMFGRVFSLIITIVIIYFSGELIWRERITKLDEISDSMPNPTWVKIVGKVLTLHLMVLVFLVLIFLSSILIQSAKGYTRFQPELYFTDLFVLRMMGFSFLIIFSVFIHSLLNDKYLSYFVVVIYYVYTILAPKFGLEHPLFKPFTLPRIVYSDMNGYGRFLEMDLWYGLLWTGLSLALLLFTLHIWVRGKENSLAQRLKFIKNNSSRWHYTVLIIAVLMITGAGGVIVYNTTVLNEYITTNEMHQRSYDYETRFKQYESLPLPSLDLVNVAVDIFPHQTRVEASGRYELTNGTDSTITRLFVTIPSKIMIFENLGRGFHLNRLDFSVPVSNLMSDTRLGVYIYELEKPLLPGENVTCNFDVTLEPRGFASSRHMAQIVKNGTFLNSYMLFPAFGYNTSMELGSSRVRERYGLPSKPRITPIDDDQMRLIVQDNAQFEAVISTSGDQSAVTAGHLVNSWSEEGRNFYQYRSQGGVPAFFTFQSARYEVNRDVWNDVNLEVWYHPEHGYNVNAMLDAMKSSLEYYSNEFSPYREQDIRIVEFPRYASFAVSTPNTIPFSEEFGFNADVDRESDDFIDYPFYIACHEVAHFWWGDRVSGGDRQGARMIDESLAEYSALMTLKHRYDEAHLRRLLRHKRDRYLKGRAEEIERDMPLYLDENQYYLHYAKGSLVYCTLQDYIGEDVLNRALRSFFDEYSSLDAEIPTSLDLLRFIRVETPDSLQGQITDLFEKITFHKLTAVEASATLLPDSSAEIIFKYSVSKQYADGNGNETAANLNDWIEVGLLDETGNCYQRQFVHVKDLMTESGEADSAVVREFRCITNRVPESIGIDPRFLMIDRDTGDNFTKVEITNPELFSPLKPMQIDLGL